MVCAYKLCYFLWHTNFIEMVGHKNIIRYNFGKDTCIVMSTVQYLTIGAIYIE